MRTKERIKSAAVELFNRDGVETVTTRHIAGHIGISQGNLHYHYPTKDRVIEVLFESFLQEISSAARNSSDMNFVKEEVFTSMKDSFNIMFRYRFLFVDNKVIWRRLPKLQHRLIELLNFKKAEIKEMILLYQKNELFRSDISSGQISFLSEQFIFTIGTWLNGSDYLEVGSDPPLFFAKFIFRFWIPYLNEPHMKEWESIIS